MDLFWQLEIPKKQSHRDMPGSDGYNIKWSVQESTFEQIPEESW